MAEDPETIDYPGYLQDALRDMVRRVLAYVAENGLPGEHYFYISFSTGHPDVHMPPFLRDQYPEAIRIVLQNQFWDLEVDETAFSVSLNFGAARQRLTVPFAALLEFADPAANLVMGFEPQGEESTEPSPEPDEPPRPGSVIRFDPKRRK